MASDRPTSESTPAARRSRDSIFRPHGVERREDPSSSDAPILDSSSTLGDYRLTRPIGKGGRRSVWETEQSSLGRKVALNVIRQEQVDEKSVRLFAREARAGGRLHHKGLVAVHATGEQDVVHFIAQELVGDGHPLADLLSA